MSILLRPALSSFMVAVGSGRIIVLLIPDPTIITTIKGKRRDGAGLSRTLFYKKLQLHDLYEKTNK